MIAGGIEYQTSGQGDAIICLHGIGGGIESFRAQLDHLKDHRIIAWAMPGYGASETDGQPPSFASLSNDLADFLQTLNIEQAHIVGHSIGGMVAMEHAIRRPDQIATLTLIGTTPAFGGKDDSFKNAFLKARLGALDAGQSMAELAHQSVPHLVGHETAPEICQSIEEIFAHIPEATWRNFLQCLVTFNRRDDLAQITQPCCVIAGELDTSAPARTMERMAGKLPNAEYHLLQNIGHMIQQEAADEVNAILSDFLGRHPL